MASISENNLDSVLTQFDSHDGEERKRFDKEAEEEEEEEDDADAVLINNPDPSGKRR